MNQQMKDKINRFDYRSASFPIRDRDFLRLLNRFRPSGYPTFRKLK